MYPHGRARVLAGYRDHGVAVTGSVEVGVDFPQSREFQPCAQVADREGTERDHVFVRLQLTIGVEDEHQMGGVLVAGAIRYLPGIKHQASPPPASHRPAGDLDDLALGVQIMWVSSPMTCAEVHACHVIVADQSCPGAASGSACGECALLAGECPSLLECLEWVPDPRDPRGGGTR